MRGIDCAYSQILKMHTWPWFREGVGDIEVKIKKFFSNFQGSGIRAIDSPCKITPKSDVFIKKEGKKFFRRLVPKKYPPLIIKFSQNTANNITNLVLSKGLYIFDIPPSGNLTFQNTYLNSNFFIICLGFLGQVRADIGQIQIRLVSESLWSGTGICQRSGPAIVMTRSTGSHWREGDRSPFCVLFHYFYK